MGAKYYFSTPYIIQICSTNRKARNKMSVFNLITMDELIGPVVVAAVVVVLAITNGFLVVVGRVVVVVVVVGVVVVGVVVVG